MLNVQSIDYRNNIEGVSVVYLCEACHEPFSMMWEEEIKLGSDRDTTEYTPRGLRRKFICDKCYQDNWKFTEHGVLMNETSVKKKKVRNDK